MTTAPTPLPLATTLARRICSHITETWERLGHDLEPEVLAIRATAEGKNVRLIAERFCNAFAVSVNALRDCGVDWAEAAQFHPIALDHRLDAAWALAADYDFNLAEFDLNCSPVANLAIIAIHETPSAEEIAHAIDERAYDPEDDAPILEGVPDEATRSAFQVGYALARAKRKRSYDAAVIAVDTVIRLFINRDWIPEAIR